MRLQWRIASIITALLLAAVGAYCIELAIPKHDYFIERAGTLQRSEIIQSNDSVAISETLRIEASTGLRVDMRFLRPAAAEGRKVPLVLVLSGHKVGKDAVDLVSDPKGIAYAAIDYPYASDRALDEFWTSAAGLYAVQQAFIDTPPAVSLALSWLLRQPWIDQENVELVGVSLGVPFAAVAGAVDKRFTRVWLMHGGGDNLSWVMHLARHQIENDTLRNLASRAALFAVYGNSFNTARWIRETAPRPVIIVAAHADDIVPRSSQEPLIGAAKSEHVELIWTEGQHVGPRRQKEIALLLDIISSRVAAAR